MILVDTSVIVDFLKGAINQKSVLFRKILSDKTEYCISAYTYQEILQGARDEYEFSLLKKHFSAVRMCFLPETIESYEKAARLYFDLRRQGITPRSVLDILIVLTALEHNLSLLHNDKDFDLISSKLDGLQICEDSSTTGSNHA